MVCPPVRGENPRNLASELSYVQVNNYCITFYTTYISVDLAHYEILRAKFGKKQNRIDCFYDINRSSGKVCLKNRQKSTF